MACKEYDLIPSVLNEDKFILNQIKLRTKLRIKSNRAKPIDFFSLLSETPSDECCIPNIKDPLFYIDYLTLEDLVDLHQDIQVFKDLEDNAVYWEDLNVIVENTLCQKQSGIVSNCQKRAVINSSVKIEIDSLLKNKSLAQLEMLYFKVNSKVSDDHNIDVTYWEELRDKLRIYIARERIMKIYESFKQSVHIKQKNEESILRDISEEFDQSADDVGEMYISEAYSPKMIHYRELSDDIFILDPSADSKKILMEQQAVKQGRMFSVKHIGNESYFVETNELQTRKSLVETRRFKPRKPHYVNRIQTGFEWNKYNQTHYDLHNPPPKVIQGYKFNIFYPDLIDKKCVPQYMVTTCSDNAFAILRFHAGPPYEDIAFKIVNQEWEYSKRKGFCCQFSNKVFQLWFHFKKLRYRR